MFELCAARVLQEIIKDKNLDYGFAALPWIAFRELNCHKLEQTKILQKDNKMFAANTDGQ